MKKKKSSVFLVNIKSAGAYEFLKKFDAKKERKSNILIILIIF